MALGEIAKGLQEGCSEQRSGLCRHEGKISGELLWLREMRKYVNEHTPEKMQPDFEEIKALDNSILTGDKAAEYRICRMMLEVTRKRRTAELYKKYLDYAEKAERREKGAAEKFIRNAGPQIKGQLAAIEVEYAEELKLLEKKYGEDSTQKEETECL